MRRSLILALLAFSLVLLPLRTGHCHDRCDWAVEFTLGFMVPLFAWTVAEIATAPIYRQPAVYYSYDEPGPLPVGPGPVSPPRETAAPSKAVGARASPSARIHQPIVGELIRPAPSDPARSVAVNLLSQGNYLRSAEAFRVLVRQRPADPELAARFAEGLLGSRNFRYGEYILRRALRGGLSPEALPPLSPPPLLAAHLSALEKRLPQEKPAGRGRLLAAYFAFALGEHSRGDAHLNALLSLHPEDGEALRLRRK